MHNCPFSYLQFRPFPDEVPHDCKDPESNFPTWVEDGGDQGSMLDRDNLDGDDVLSIDKMPSHCQTSEWL